jgi:hypothetical protein
MNDSSDVHKFLELLQVNMESGYISLVDIFVNNELEYAEEHGMIVKKPNGMFEVRMVFKRNNT